MDIKVTIPESMADITLSDYQKFIKISDGKDFDVFIQQKMISIFCNIPLLAVSKLNRQDFKAIVVILSKILEEKHELQPIIKIDGKEYGFIPNLRSGFTFGEFVDLDNLMKEWSTFHQAMSILYRPVVSKKGTKYIIEPYDSNAPFNHMERVTMDVVTGATLFFWNLSRTLLEVTPKYLQQQLAKNPQAEAALQKNGVGMHTFINSLAEASLKLEMLLHRTWVPL